MNKGLLIKEIHENTLAIKLSKSGLIIIHILVYHQEPVTSHRYKYYITLCMLR